MTEVIKAKRAVIKLGDIDLDVFQLPNGEYRMSKKQSCEVVELDRKRLSEIFQKKALKAILGEGRSLSEFTIPSRMDGNNARMDLLPIPLVLMLWNETEKGKALVSAAAWESIERRADIQFNIIRTEEERNERLVTRRDSILSRDFWTDVIDAFMKAHDVSADYRKFVYINVSNYLNKALFGMTSKQIREHYDIGDNSPRDYFPTETLKLIETIEKATAVRVKKTDSCPKQAIKDVVNLLGIEPDPTLL